MSVKASVCLFFVAIALLALSAYSLPADDRAEKKDYLFSLEHDGAMRYYRVYLPRSYNKDFPLPVVIYLHGGGGSMRAAYRDGMDKASEKFGFILAVPAGTGPFSGRLLTWNGGEWSAGASGPGTESCCGYAAKHGADDVGFISKMIDRIKTDFHVDENRIYATGISNGGIMSYRLACELSDKIAAIAPVAPPAVPLNCRPARPVPVMHIHGTVDPCAPYRGGTGGGCLGVEKYAMQSAEEMTVAWKGLNGCSDDSVVRYAKGAATCVAYRQCRDGADVELCTVEGMGHAYPSGAQYLSEDRIGPVSYDISFEQIWEFFKRHALGAARDISRGPGDHEFAISHDSLERTYRVHVPPDYDKNISTPLVINLHGGYGNAEAAEKMTGMNQISDEEDFIVAYPNAVRGPYDEKSKMHYRHWNAGARADSFKSHDVDDVRFISRMIDKLKEDFNINSDRIYATGMSNGATMVYRLACQLSDKIAAFAPVAGNQLDIVCRPSRPVPIIHFHGLADNFATFDGKVFGDQRESIPELISGWAARNGCSGAPVMNDPAQGVTCKTYGTCAENAEVVLCAIEEAGHAWPGRGVYMGARVCEASPDGILCGKLKETYGKQRYDFSANEVMWQFFQRHPLEKKEKSDRQEVVSYVAGDHVFFLKHDGLSRRYKIHFPKGHSRETKRPVVIYIHGGGGDMRAAYMDGIDKFSDKYGFILAVPEGTGDVRLGHMRAKWNGGKWAGGECCGSADDVGFIVRMIDAIKENFGVDEKRIYATGISNGGLMVNRLACELSDRIVAIAAVAPAGVMADCRPVRPMSVMDIHGTADPANPPDGSKPRGIFQEGSGSGFAMPYKRMTPDEVVAKWKKINGCSEEYEEGYSRGGAHCVTYNQCAAGAEVALCMVEGMGHAYPSGSQYLSASMVGRVSYDISFNQIWEFFKRHRRE